MMNFNCFFILFLQIFLVLCSGKFEIELERLINRKGVNINGTCCSGPDQFLTCLQPCKTFLRFCLRNRNPNMDNINRQSQIDNAQCTYSFDETPILGGNNIHFNRLPQTANLIVLPFKFSWMGDFVLEIDILNDKSSDGQPFEGSERELIMSTIIRSSILPNSSWHDSQTIDASSNEKEFSFRYRVSCSTNFYGSQCSRFCSPLSIHSRCDTNTGDIICQQGWTGNDCNIAICREGCQHGNCHQQPGQCICTNGWIGDNCHIALNTCENNPCLNSGECVNLPNGQYRCQCSKYYSGYHCESLICPKCEHDGKCPLGYRGLLCEERICLNGGLTSLGKCLCPPGYQGEQCEIESKCPICRNNGQCEDKKCRCTKYFVGQYCEIDIRLMEKKEKKIFSIELIITLSIMFVFISIIILLSYLLSKYRYRREKQLKQIYVDKIWTIESSLTNIFKEKTNSIEKLAEKKDINSILKQIDVQASLV